MNSDDIRKALDIAQAAVRDFADKLPCEDDLAGDIEALADELERLVEDELEYREESEADDDDE